MLASIGTLMLFIGTVVEKYYETILGAWQTMLYIASTYYFVLPRRY